MSTIKVDTIATRTGSGNITLSNSLASATVAGDLAVDTNVLKVDSTNNRVGIGTASPGRKLELNNGGTGAFVTFTDGVATNFTFKTDGNQVGTFGTEAGSTHLGFMASGTERARIHSSGVMSVSNGIELGSGLDATAANVLDDYEEGSFVPILKHEIGDALTVGYASNFTHGRYTKIGTLVTFQLTIDVDSVSGGASNQQLVVPNLPFTAKSYQTNSNGGASMTYLVNLNTNITYGIVLGSSTTLRFYSAPATPSYGNTVTSSTHIQCYGQYETDS
tara:strand:- start:256 stop:1083 length:828 start_codon:yes stop_codon:yes gene_type:complete